MTLERIESLYKLVEQEAQAFFESVVEARDSARNEREFQTRVTIQIEGFAEKAGVKLELREEYTVATGRADAVYNRLVIEYEKPGSMRLDREHGHTRHAIGQVKNYIHDVAKKDKHDRDRLLGVALDGVVLVFARYLDGHWYEEPPLEVNRQSMSRFLRFLVSLSSGRALIPENLVEDFGARSMHSQRATRALYHALDGHTKDLTANLFRQWQLFFGQVSGHDGETAKIRKKKELRQFALGMGLSPGTTDTVRLFFAIHTYFSFLIKAIAKLVLERYAGGQLGTTPLTVLANLEGEALKRELEKLEQGGVFRTLGLVNLLEGDFFSWYLQAWSPGVEEALRLTLIQLSEYNPSTIEDDPYSARDLLKKLYHYLLPKELRHDLGEYYTPDWLAERVLTQLDDPLYVHPKTEGQLAKLFPARRVLDPACGSGTFLVLAIRAIKEHALRQGLGEADALEYILNCVVGVDLNPLAVMAARVNYLLAIADLIPHRTGPVVLPVYLADSILTPSEGATLFEQAQRRLQTVVGDLPIPKSISSAEGISKLTDLLDEYIPNQFSIDSFLDIACRDLGIARGGLDEEILRELYSRLLELERQGLDGIWARILKNAFMPLFIGEFDYIAGNPPWVNWESLPEKYRKDTSPLWDTYKLFPHKGFKAILGGSKDDISILMTYVSCDRYLRDNGRLAFLITQTVFKSAEGGRGFRRFRLGDGEPLGVLHVDDMSRLKPFEGAANRTSAVIIQKGRETRFPVPYTYWSKAERGGRLSYESSLEEVVSMTSRANFQAVPVEDKDPTSAWLTARPGALRALGRIIGKSDYQSRKGVYASANGVFWLERMGVRPDGRIVARNMAEVGKLSVDAHTVDIEPDLIYPLLRGRDVSRWFAEPSAHILLTHLLEDGLRAISTNEMERQYPRTLAFLKNFETTLLNTGLIRRYFTKRDKRGKTIHTGPFYSMFNIGDYTFAPYKVVLREISTSLIASVVDTEEGRPIVPDHKLILVPFATLEEAHYVCALLNTKMANLLILSYAVTTQISTHIFKHLAIPKFDGCVGSHRKLAQLSIEAHGAAAKRDSRTLKQLDSEIDRIAANLWGCTDEELVAIRFSLEELMGSPNGRIGNIRAN